MLSILYHWDTALCTIFSWYFFFIIVVKYMLPTIYHFNYFKIFHFNYFKGNSCVTLVHSHCDSWFLGTFFLETLVLPSFKKILF